MNFPVWKNTSENLSLNIESEFSFLKPKIEPVVSHQVNIIISSSCRATSTDIPDHLSPLFFYRSSPLAGLQGYIPYPHIAAECMFVLVVRLLPGHMWESIGVHHL